MSHRRVRAFLTVAALAVGFSAYAYGSTGGDVAFVATYLGLCAVAWWSALRRQPAGSRRPWLLVAAAISLWCAGDLIEVGLYHFGEVPTVGLSDAAWLGGYLLLAAALIQMAVRRAGRGLRSAVLDGLTLTVAAAAAAWQFLIMPAMRAEAGSTLELVVPALYPVADIAVLAALLLITLAPGTRSTPTRLLLAAVLLYLAVDLSYNLVPWLAPDADLGRLGLLIMLGNALVIAAGLHPARAELTRPGHQVPSLHPARVLFLGLALLTAPTLSLVDSGFDGQEIMALAAMALCSGFVLSRFTIAVREQERVQARLVHQARHDPLTGLANRTVLTERLARRLPAGDAPVTVLYLDLDGFKQINDQYGHDAGDAVLLATARRLSAAVRESDVVSRFGGDEFVLFCPGVPADEAIRLAERILLDVAEPVPHRGRQFTVGASIGITVHHGADASGPASVLRSADAAMYDAKRGGRGRWVLAGS